MQNKGFVKVFAVLLTLVCLFYMSFTFVTRYYDNKAATEANGDPLREAEILDSLSTKKVWLGYTLKQCREREIGLGLDLKGGMTVMLEIDAAAVLQSLANTDDPQFQEAIKQTVEENTKGTSKDFVSLFVEKYESINKDARLVDIFGSGSLKEPIEKINKDKNKVTNAQIKSVLDEEMQSVASNSFQILTTRIDRYGVVAPNIQKLNNRAERILVELPGIKEPERVKKLLQGNANLEFWRVFDRGAAISDLAYVNEESAKRLDRTTAAPVVADSTATAANDSTTVEPDSAKQAAPQLAATETADKDKLSKTLFEMLKVEAPVSGAVIGLANRNDTAAINEILYKFRDSYPIDLKFAWGFKAFSTDNMDKEVKAEYEKAIEAVFGQPYNEETYFELYALRGVGTKKGPTLEGDVITSARVDLDPQKGYQVSMQMNSKGTTQWSAITEDAMQKKEAVAILLDGYVYSAPNVQSKIDGGSSVITGNFTVQEARDLENVLKSGKMKAGIRIVQEDIVGPSLGQEAIQAGVVSFIIALVVLLTYIFLMYGFIPGLIANGALLVNIFFTIGILASFRAVLTLPGIAGLVLSLAMSVDANVLIYERTKEELRAGKNVKNAIMDGYKHAFSAIFDGNLTSIITAAILIYFGSGPIRGFATTLLIGIIASFFTAVYLTRVVYDYFLSRGKFGNLTFVTAISKNFLTNTKIQFLKLHKQAFILSGVILALGVVSLFTLKLNQGIDFTGGRNYIVQFEQNVKTSDVEKALTAEFEESGALIRVITMGSDKQRITTNYKIDASNPEQVELEIREKFNNALKGYIAEGQTINDYIQSVQVVGPSVAEDLIKSSFIAVILAIICMGLYILIRFRDMAFSVGTIVAVAHDAFFVIVMYSFLYKIMPFSMEIDQTFIAAILTVVGYSINDKVVIFDRIREIRKNYPTRPIGETVNEALNSTISRTFNTSFSTFLVVLCIFIFGGDTIRSFTFAMLIGVVISTYSSLFTATPIAYEMLKNKFEKKKAK
ncbi:protein translocase subunit SecDF [Dysgonomonas sp. 520]|uniref:protein translocase subunit SecDF n=1 Tax=Dysgonomonas sp. 520 TaxID=2302931 RepID=UPI0013D647F2|nr:protein translocase subunit SecDF [Dysgonomonas sp. 520]NDW10008.1 protein translocase subunit SecDF [Dysgonomonas sp. 520]